MVPRRDDRRKLMRKRRKEISGSGGFVCSAKLEGLVGPDLSNRPKVLGSRSGIEPTMGEIRVHNEVRWTRRVMEWNRVRRSTVRRRIARVVGALGGYSGPL